MESISIVLIGIGGYGENYVKEFFEAKKNGRFNDVEVIAAVDPAPERCRVVSELKNRNIPVYSSLEAFYETNTADLAVISTPIYLHTSQICYCLSKGSNVLCEKPLCALYEDALKIIETEKVSGKSVGIGYQLSFFKVIQELKKDIQDGLYGTPIRLKTLVNASRNQKYYGRAKWAGAIVVNEDNWVLDSPANNAHAHQLHNMFYVLGKTRETSAVPVSVTAELYRGNFEIQNFDTAAIKTVTDEGVEILFYTTHAIAKDKIGMIFSFEFDKAVLKLDSTENKNLTAYFKDGSIKMYDSFPDYSVMEKLSAAIENIRTGIPMACGPIAASAQTLCVNMAWRSMEEIQQFPEHMVKRVGNPGELYTDVDRLEEALLNCFNENKLPSEIGLPWAKKGKVINFTY